MGNDTTELLTSESYTVAEVAQILHCDKRTIYRYFDLHYINHFRISERKTLVTKKELQRFIDSRLKKKE